MLVHIMQRNRYPSYIIIKLQFLPASLIDVNIFYILSLFF